ncbi:MAG TPA: ATP-binding protein [bacterium]|nr:ATP-binding protein [bacterium]
MVRSRKRDPKSAVAVSPHAEALREMAQRYENLVQNLSILRQLDELDRPDREMQVLCREMVETIAFGLAAENCSLMLLDHEKTCLQLRAACGPYQTKGQSYAPGEWGGESFPLGYGIVGKVAQAGVPIRVNDVSKEKDFLPRQDSLVELGSLMSFPLRCEGEVIGVLNVSHREKGFFSAESLATLALIAERTAQIISNRLVHEELRRSEIHLREILENAGDAILVYDASGELIDANSAVERITGIAPQKYIQQEVKWESGVHPDDAEQYTVLLSSSLATGKPELFEYRYLDPQGGIHYLEQKNSRFLDSSNQVERIVVTIRDTTERRQLQEQLIKAQKMESLGVLAGGVAHDFSNLLTSIVGNSSLMLSEMPSESPLQEGLKQIAKAAEIASGLCRQMLAYSGKGRFVVLPINLTDVVNEMKDLLDVTVSKTVEIRYELDTSLPCVEADAAQMYQVISNLVTNASESIGNRKGTVTIKTASRECTREFFADCYLNLVLQEGSYVMLEVSDTGCGMTPETMQKMFDPFFTTKFTGRGLGLSAVLGIVRGHSGTIQVNSEPGQGTTFRLLLPATDRCPSNHQPAHVESKTFLRGLTILVVDDDPAVLDLIELILDGEGSKVLKATDGLEALDVYQAHAKEIALVILDMTMPNLSGEDTLFRLRAIDPDVRVLLSSGYSETPEKFRFEEWGAKGFIHKPYPVADLIKAIERSLD